MKTEVKKLEGNKREIGVEVTGEVVKNKFAEVFKKIGQEAKVPGFRAGHVPADILEKNFSAVAREQVLKELIPDLYNQALDKEGLDAVELPQIAEVKLERTSLSFKATFEVSPEIPLKKYKGIKINYVRITVSPEEIKRSLDSLKESRKLESIDDNFARSAGYPDMGELQKALERQIYLNKDRDERQKIEHQIIESLTKDVDFKLPQSLIDRQLEDLVRQTKVDLAMKGIPREKIEEGGAEIRKNLEPQARQQIKVYLILSEIAKKENIPLDEQMSRRVMEFLLKEAEWAQAA